MQKHPNNFIINNSIFFHYSYSHRYRTKDNPNEKTAMHDSIVQYTQNPFLTPIWKFHSTAVKDYIVHIMS